MPRSLRSWPARAASVALLAAAASVAVVGDACAASDLPPLDSDDLYAQALASAGGGATPAPARLAVGRELVLEVRVNDALVDEAALVRVAPDGALLIPVALANAMRLRFDGAALIDSAGERYLPLAAVPGLRYTLDERASRLEVGVDPALFTTTSVAVGSGPAAQPNEFGLGGFLNYDLLLQRSSLETTSGAQFLLGAFDGFGVLTSEQRLTGGASSDSVRLNTTLRKDFPDALKTLRLGDFTSYAGSLGNAALIGGVQWGTNFALQPTLVTFPFQSLSGEATLPSTVDVYVNGALRSSVDAPPGPFEIAQIPVITGQGTVRMVVTDSLGRSVVVEQPFFASARLLRAGLHEQSWELGLLREDFGVVSNAYGRQAGVTTHRWGLNDRFTGELRVELVEDQSMAGVGGVLLTGEHGVLLFGAAVGGAGSTRGQSGSVGFQGQWGSFSLSADLEGSSREFTQLGLDPAAPPAYSTASTAFGWYSGTVGSLGLALVRDKPRIGAESRIANLSWSRQVGGSGGGYLALSLFEDFEDPARRGLSLTYSLNFGARTSAAATVSQQGEESPRLVVQAQRGLGRGPDHGWRVQADGEGNASAQYDLQSDHGLLRIGGDKTETDTRAFVGAVGGVSWLDGALMPSRRIENAFGLVRVPGMSDVRVYFDGELVGRTDADGELLIPTLRPYQANEVRIDAEDLPFEIALPVDRLVGVPFHGSGVLLEFPARLERSATLTLRRADGRPVPAGARVTVGDATPQPVGDDGFTFLPLPTGRSTLEVRWNGGACRAALELPAESEPLPDLGIILCEPAGATADPR